MTNSDIEMLALEAGFSLKEQLDGSMGLNEYVFKFAKLLLEARKMEIESIRHEINTCRAVYSAAIKQRDDARTNALALLESKRELLDTAEKACQYIEGIRDALVKLGARTDESTVNQISSELRTALNKWALPH